MPSSSLDTTPRYLRSLVFEAMIVANYYLRPPTQELEFVAKVITTDSRVNLSHYLPHEQFRMIPATPLYVAQVHPLLEDDPSGAIAE